MQPNWLVAKPAALTTWQPKIDLLVDSQPQHAECYILANNDIEAIQVWVKFGCFQTTLGFLIKCQKLS